MKGTVSLRFMGSRIRRRAAGPLGLFLEGRSRREGQVPSDGMAVGEDSCHPSGVHGSSPIRSHAVSVTGSRYTLASVNVTAFQGLTRV